MTVRRSRGMVTSRLRRLCSRAPRTISDSSGIIGESSSAPAPEARARYHSGRRNPQIALPSARLPRPRCTGTMAHTDALVVLTTVANADEAVKLMRALLDRRLVACGTLIPGARSLYRWDDKVADE